MKVSDIYVMHEGIKEIMDKEIKVSASYKLYKNLKIVEEEINSSEAIRIKIVEKYQESIEGNVATINPKMVDKFNKDMEELMNQEVDIALNKISIEELEDIKIKPNTINKLNLILKE